MTAVTLLSNPRIVRVVSGLLAGPLAREELDRLAGASNGPQIVARLRRAGLEVPCQRIEVKDRDGNTCRPGIYRLSPSDAYTVRQWLKGGAAC